MSDFDIAAYEFTRHLQRAADWQDAYFGAAYATRIRQAIKEAREACEEMEAVLEKDKK
jgi:hypothetical protein